MQVHEADFDDDHELPQVKAVDKKLQAIARNKNKKCTEFLLRGVFH